MTAPQQALDSYKANLDELSAAATPGPWKADPKRLIINNQAGPIMCYLAGHGGSEEGMKVSLGSERIADHHFVAALVNAYRDGTLHFGPKGEAKIHIERLLRQLDEYESDDDLEAVASEGSRDSREAHDKWLTRVRAREWIDSRDATKGDNT